MEPVRLIVAGSRFAKNECALRERLNELKGSIEVLISGAALGPDSWGIKWAKENDVPLRVFFPRWSKLGRAAGIVRNKEMLDFALKGNGLLVACWDGKSRGTKNMISVAKKAGVPVEVLVSDPAMVHFENESNHVLNS